MASGFSFVASTPPLMQLGQTIGRGINLTPAQASGMSPEQYEDYKSLFTNVQEQLQRDADRTYGLSKAKLDNEYNIARRSAKTAEEANDIDRAYKEASVAILRDRLVEDGRQFNMSFGEGQRQFDATLGLNQAKLGYDLIGTAANLRGAENYFQAADYARGVAAQPGTATFLDALKNNTNLTGFGAQAGAPSPETLGTLTAKLGGSDAGGGNEGYLSTIGGIGQAGAHRLGAGALENLTPTERGLFTSGLDRLGYDTPTFLSQYQRSRIGSSGNVRAA